MDLNEAASLLGISKDRTLMAIESGIETPSTRTRIRLVAAKLTHGYDVAQEDLDQFIAAFERDDAGRHPPVAVRRTLLIESGYKCAVCRENGPLEFHHIIEWATLKHHDPEHMLAICANCHGKITRYGEPDAIGQKQIKRDLCKHRQFGVPLSVGEQATYERGARTSEPQRASQGPANGEPEANALAGPPIDTRVSPEKLLDDLKRLTVSQFEELTYYLGVDTSHLPSAEAPLARRALELCKMLGQQERGLNKLRRKLDELGWFKRLLPRGMCPVSAALRAREEDRERLRSERALALGQTSDADCVSPKQFFSFREQTAWLAVFRNWDAPRTFRTQLVDRAIESIELPKAPLAAAIVGPGGSGKSVALRRLGVDLFERGYDVWWVEDFRAFLYEGLSVLVEDIGQPRFVLIDEVELYGDDLRRLLVQTKENDTLRFVFAGRELPTTVRWPQRDTGLFEPDEAADRVSILRKIAELVPEWAIAARQLEIEPLRRERLIRILFALARLTTMPTTATELQEAFLDILADDVTRAGNAVPGLTEAIVDAAVLRQIGVDVDHPTLVQLAERHSSGARYLLEEVQGNERWQVVRPLLEHGVGNKWRFHHDELAEGLLAAASGPSRRLGSRIVADDGWRRRLLHWIAQVGTPNTYSSALHGLVRHRPGLLSSKEVLEHIDRLVASGCEHHAYVELSVLNELKLEEDARFGLLLRLAHVAPGNPRLWSVASRWLHAHCSQERRSQLAARIIEESKKKSGTVQPGVMVLCLRLMSLAEAQIHARRLIGESCEHGVIRYCLNLLGNEAIDDARRLIRTSQDHDVLCACLSLLGDEAKPEARRLLKTSIHHEVLTRCLKLLGNEAKADAARLLSESQEQDVLCACLGILGESAKEDARRLLAERDDRYLTIVCLRLLGADAKDEAKRLLRTTRSSDTQCLCLKFLGVDAKEEARRLLKESRRHNVLCVCLNILGAEAKEEARRFLLEPTTPVELLNRSLAVLGDEAAEYAVAKLVQWREHHTDLVACCLGIAWRTREAQVAALEMLSEWESLPTQLRVAALGTPVRHELRVARAQEVVKRWRSESRMLLAAAMNAYGEKPAGVTSVCRAVLHQWRHEIEVQRAKKYDRHDIHIVKAMSHPLLRDESRTAARAMLDEEIHQPGLLTEELKECAEDLIRGKYAPWAREQRSSMRRRTS